MTKYSKTYTEWNLTYGLYTQERANAFGEVYHKINEAGNLWFARIAILFSEELSCCFSLLR